MSMLRSTDCFILFFLHKNYAHKFIFFVIHKTNSFYISYSFTLIIPPNLNTIEPSLENDISLLSERFVCFFLIL